MALAVVLALVAGVVTLAEAGRAPEAQAVGGLALTTARDLAVDPGTGRVFVTGDDAVQVFAPDGTSLAVIPNVYGAAGIDVGGGFVYVGESTAGAIAKIDPVAMAVVHVFTLGTTVGTNLAVVGNGAFYGLPNQGLRRFDLVTSSLVTVGAFGTPEPRRIPNSATQLLVADTPAFSSQVTITRIAATAPFVPVATWSRTDSYAPRFATNGDASRVIVNDPYCYGCDGFHELDAALAPTQQAYLGPSDAPTWSPGHGGVFASASFAGSFSRIVAWREGSATPYAAVNAPTTAQPHLRLSADGNRAYLLSVPTYGSGTSSFVVRSIGTAAAAASPNPVVRDVPTDVKVTGTGLGATTGVTVAGIAAPMTRLAPDAVGFTLPNGVPTGIQTVTLASPFGSTSVLLTVQANTGATLHGTVRRGTTPVSGATLSLTGGGLGAPVTTSSAADGTYTLAGLGAGTDYALAVHDPAGGPDQTQRPITLTPNLTTTVDLDVSRPLPGRVELARTPLGGDQVKDLLVVPASGRVLVSVGDEVDVLSPTGAPLGRVVNVPGAGRLAMVGSQVFVASVSLNRIVRIDPTTVAVTGSWPAGGADLTRLASAAGRLWSPRFTLGSPTVLVGFDPATGTSTDVLPAFEGNDLFPVTSRPNKLVSLESWQSALRVLDMSTNPYTPTAPVANNPAPATPLAASGNADRIYDAAGRSFFLSSLAPDGVYYGPFDVNTRPAVSDGHGGLVAFGSGKVFRTGLPAATHGFTGSSLQAFDAAGDRIYRVDHDRLVVDTLAPVVNGVGSPVVTARPVVLTGSGLGATSAVTVDGSSVPFSVGDASTITITGPSAGLHTVVVTTPWGSSSPVPITVAASAVPTPPLDVQATASPDTTVGHISWSAPANDGGLPITGYTVTSSPAGAGCSTAGALTCDVTAPSSGWYAFSVVAANSAGPSPASAESSSVWLAPPVSQIPTPPSSVFASPSAGAATVSWAYPPSGPTPTSYTVTAYTAGGTPLVPSVDTAGFQLVFTGLTPGSSYMFRVVAHTPYGDSPPSDYSQLVTIPSGLAPPTPPGNAKGIGVDRQVYVSWSWPASDGGTPITGFTATAVPGNRTCTTNGNTSCLIDGLTNGVAYTVTVTANNVMGASAPSAASAPITPVADGGASYFPLPPGRILDSRADSQVGPYGTPWTTGTTRDVPVIGGGGVPAGATAVALNVTVTGTSNPGFLTIWPTQADQPVASSINWAAGQTVANAVTVPVGPDGHVQVFAAGGPVDVIFDVVGYYQPAFGVGDGLVPLAPHRLFDSRASTQLGPYNTPWGPGTSRPVTVAGLGGIPADADAVVLNVTVTSTTAASFLTLSPAGQPRPLSSSLNWSAGQTIPNAVVAKVGTGGQIDVFNNAGTADVILDVAGYFAKGTGAQFHPLTPTRTLDSRPASKVGPYDTPWGPQTARSLAVAGGATVPASAVAVQHNMTVTDTSAASYLTVFPGDQPQPLVSSLNWSTGRTVANQVITPIGGTGDIWIANRAGTADVIADVNGWFG